MSKGNASFHVKINCGNIEWGRELSNDILQAWQKKGFEMTMIEGVGTWEIWGKIKDQENNKEETL